MLLRVWRRLLAEGVPQRNRFNLVFVGRRGWMVEGVLREIDEMRGKQSFLQHFADLSDENLAELYRQAAFCLYPSVYEGFGLPIVEAFSYGKAVLASSGGALPETVAGLSPCIDPLDEETWYVHLKHWIEDPKARRPFEQKIRASYRPATWPDVARHFFAAAIAT
jgi:glycosyltransferase involved in cell wall biosynthesis